MTDDKTALQPVVDATPAITPIFTLGDRVVVDTESKPTGMIVGYYSTELTPVGYCVELQRGSVQVYPEGALTKVVDNDNEPQMTAYEKASTDDLMTEFDRQVAEHNDGEQFDMNPLMAIQSSHLAWLGLQLACYGAELDKVRELMINHVDQAMLAHVNLHNAMLERQDVRPN